MVKVWLDFTASDITLMPHVTSSQLIVRCSDLIGVAVSHACPSGLQTTRAMMRTQRSGT